MVRAVRRDRGFAMRVGRGGLVALGVGVGAGSRPKTPG